MEDNGASLIGWLVATIFFIVPAWRILGRAGYPGVLALLMLVPLLGSLCIFIILAFTQWPALKRQTTAAIASTFE
jgi:hypothetical protein